MIRRLLQEIDQDFALQETRYRFASEKIGLRSCQNVPARFVKTGEFRTRKTVITTILRSIGQEGTIRTNARRDDRLKARSVRAERIPRAARQMDRFLKQGDGLSFGQSFANEPLNSGG